MGGFGSGRPAIRSSLGSLYSVRTRQLRLACDFRPGMRGHVTFDDGTCISLASIDDAILVNEVCVPLDHTEPFLGGHRVWFLCPNRGCGRRCTVVYGREQQWACRCCWGANYPSQKEDRIDRLLRRARILRRRLKGFSDLAPIDHVDRAGYPPRKPPRMHWRTYSRLTSELVRIETEAARLFREQSGRLMQRLQARGIS